MIARPACSFVFTAAVLLVAPTGYPAAAAQAPAAARPERP